MGILRSLDSSVGQTAGQTHVKVTILASPSLEMSALMEAIDSTMTLLILLAHVTDPPIS